MLYMTWREDGGRTTILFSCWWKVVVTTAGGAQGLLHTLCSGVIPGNAQVIIYGARDRTWVDHIRALTPVSPLGPHEVIGLGRTVREGFPQVGC